MQKHTIHREKTQQFSRLATTLTYHQEQLTTLLSAPFSLENVGAQITRKKANYSTHNRQVLVRELKKQFSELPESSPVFANIQKLENQNTFTITTGHQLNIGTGPAYVIYKIIHCIRLAEELKKTYPTFDFVPVFWLATEDHDIDEVNHTTIFGKKISWNENQGGAVGKYALNHWEEMKAEIAAFFQNNPESEIHQLLQKYTGKNVADATQQLFHALFEKEGVIVLEPNVSGLKTLFVETMQREAQVHFVEECVHTANQTIEQLGFSPQAFARPINLFRLSEGKRERLLEVNNAEVLKEMHVNPDHFSPNVLLRPAFQETILPNLVYIGGGGEISYWIQQKEIFKKIGVEFPLLSVRNSVQIIDATTFNKWKKLGFSWEDIFTPLQEIQSQYIKSNSGEELNFTSLDIVLEKLQGVLQNHATFFDQNMEKFVEAESTRLSKQMEAIKAKFVKQRKSQLDLAMKQLEDLKAKLLPNNALQERTESFFSFCKDGAIQSKIELLKSVMDPFENDLIVLLLD
jgi:bacillithiol biosynthesis cysteine-adding enzyme BshC